MRELELAKKILREENLSLVIVKGAKVLFKSGSSGISGLLQAIENLNEKLHKSSVADRVIGRAAALLLVYFHAEEVYGATVSREGLRVLKEGGIPLEHGNIVSRILDREGKDICPFERFSLAISSPEEAYEKLRAFAEGLKGRK